MIRRIWIPLVLGVAASLGGCNCNAPVEEKKVSISAPKSGAKLTMRDDVDNATAGLQFQVTAATEKIATDGSGFVRILVDGKVSNQGIVGTDGTATVVIDTTALETGADGSHVLTAIAGDDTGTAESAKVAITVDSSEVSCEVTITEPANGAVLSSKADLDPARAGIQSVVAVHTAGCGATGRVRVCMQGQGLTGTACKGNVGIAVGEATISQSNTTSITVDWAEGAVVVIGEHEAAQVTDSPAVMVTVDSSTPTCTFVAPAQGAVLGSQNVDVQLKVTGAESGQPVTLTSTLKPEAQTGTNNETGNVTIAATLPLGEQTLTATVADAAGNEGTCAVTVTVDLDGCDVELTDPPSGQYLFNIANASPSGTPLMGRYTVRGKTTRCAGGVARFSKTVNGVESDLGTADVDGNGGFSRLLLFPDGEEGATLTVKVDKAGMAPNAGTSFTYATDFVAPTCAFVSPTDGATVTTQNPSVQVTVTDAEVDQDVVLSSSAKQETMTGKVTEVGGEVTIAASLPVGQQTLTVTVEDQAKNSGTCSIQVTVDVDGCDVALSDPPTGTFVFNIANSNPTGTPAVGKHLVAGSTTRCAGGTARFVKTVGGVDTDLGTAAVDASGGFSKLLDFPDGEAGATMTVKVELAGMAENAGASFTYSTDFTAPTCAFVSPTDGAVVATQTPDVQLSVTDAEVDQDVTLTSTGKPDAMVGKMTASGDVTIPASLPLGAQTLSVVVADQAGNVGTCEIGVTVDVQGCDIVLTDPASPELIVNIANGNPTGSPLEGKYLIQGTTTRCAGGTVSYTKTVGGSTSTGTAAIAANGSFGFEVTFADGEFDAVINIKADKAGVAPNAGVDVAYFSDFTPPTIDQAVPALGNLYVVNASNPHLIDGELGYVLDEDASAAGGTVTVNVNATGFGTVASAGYGSALTGSATVSVGAATPISMTAGNNAQQTVSGTLVLAEGFTGPVLITLTDSAGNVTTGQWDARVATEALPGTITLETPSGTVNAINAKSTDRSTYATVESYIRFGQSAPPGSTIRLCSSAAGGDGSCSTSGYSLIAGTAMAASGTFHLYPQVTLHHQGAYSLVAELVDPIGTSTVPSASKNVNVDFVPPRVSALALNADSNGDGMLNGTEWPLGQPTTITATFEGVEDGRSATLEDPANGVLFSKPVSGGTATFTINSLDDKSYSLVVNVKDAAANPNLSMAVSPPIVNPEASRPLVVKRLPPSISKVAPTFAICNIAQDADKASTDTCELDFVVAVNAGEAARVDFTVEPPGAGTLSPASVTSFTNGRATSRYSLAQSTSLTTLKATVTDHAGNTWTTSHPLTLVDTIAPSLTIIAPASGSTVFSQTVGFGAETDAEAGRKVTVRSLLGAGQDVGLIDVVAGSPLNTTAPGATVTLPYGDQTLRAQVTDLAGNPSDAAFTTVHMELNGCDLTFENPSAASVVFNASNAPGGLVTIRGYSSRQGCENQPLVFSVSVDGGPETTVGSGSERTDAAGNFSFDYAFADGTVTVFSAEVAVSGSLPSSFSAVTDITPPSLLTISAPVTDASKNLFVVAKTGNVRIGTAGYLPDTDANLDGGQASFNVRVAGAGVAVGSGSGWLDVRQGTGDCLAEPQPAGCVIHEAIADNGTVDLNGLLASLEEAPAGPLTITATDSAGNQISETWTVTVDVTKPTVPQLVLADPGDGRYTHVTNERHADVEIYVQTPDDPDTLTWDFGYTNDLKLGTNPLNEAAFGNPAITTKVTLSSAGAGLMTASLLALPPLNTYRLMPRVVDPLGNRSDLVATVLPILWTSASLSYPGTMPTGARFGYGVLIGDFNGDGAADVVVRANENQYAGSVTVYYGGSVPLQQKWRKEGAAPYSFFGMPTGVGDLNGDARSDLVVANGMKADVYLTTSAGEVPETATFSITSANRIGAIGIVADLNNDTLPDLVLGVPSASSNAGVTYLFFGRSDWTPILAGGAVDVSAADVIITGQDAGGYFGAGKAPLSVPDLDGDGHNELLVAAEFAAKGHLFLGKTLTELTRSATTSDAVQVFTGQGATDFVFSSAMADVNGDGLDDLILGSNDVAGKAFVYPRQGAGFLNDPVPTAFFSGGGAMGATLATGDLNGDGRRDLFISGRVTTSQPLNAFWSRNVGILAPPESVLSGGAGFGFDIAIGDVNGDGKVDLIIGEASNGNGNVQILY